MEVRPYHFRDVTKKDWDCKTIPKDMEANCALRRDFLWRGAHYKEAAKWLRKKCADDILFWVNMFCFTYDPRKKQKDIPFITYEYQDEAILAIQGGIRDGVDVAIEKSRDMGASWMNVLVPTHDLLFGSSANFKLVSRNEKYVDDGSMTSLFGKIRYLIDHHPKWLRPSKMTDRSMFIRNDDLKSSITGESTTGEVARGDRNTAILLDEFAAFETKAGYAALASTQAATNCRIFNSTPKGQANAFYDVVHKTSARVIRMHWSKHPEKRRGLYTSERDEASGRLVLKLLDDWRGMVEVREKGSKVSQVYAFPENYPFILDGKTRSPWYDRECSRAVNQVEIAQELDIDYTGSDYQFFDPLAIERYREKWCRDPEFIGDVEIDSERSRVLRLTPNAKGHFYLYEPLPRGGKFDADRRFVVGVDVSAGTGASNSTASFYDRKTNTKVAEFVSPNVLPDDFGRLVVALARFFNNAKIVPDRSGPTGEVFVSRVLSQGYTNLYFRRNTKKLGNPMTDEPGVWLNPQTKTEILQKYRDAIGHVSIINCSEQAMAETLRFIMTQNGNVEHSSEGSAQDPNGARTNHGDLVIADALANLELSDTEAIEEPKNNEIPPDTLAWRMEEERKRIESLQKRDDLGEEWEP